MKKNEKSYDDNETLVVTKASLRLYRYAKMIVVCSMALFAWVYFRCLVEPRYLLVVAAASPKMSDVAALAEVSMLAIVALFMIYHFAMVMCESIKYGPSNEDMKRLSNTLEDEKRKHDCGSIDEEYMLHMVMDQDAYDDETYKYPKCLLKDADHIGTHGVRVSKNHVLNYENCQNGNVLVMGSDKERLKRWTNANLSSGVNSLILCTDKNKHYETCKNLEEKGFSVHTVIAKMAVSEVYYDGVFNDLFSKKNLIVIAEVSKDTVLSAAFLQFFLKVAKYRAGKIPMHVYLEDNILIDWLTLPNDGWLDDMFSQAGTQDISYRVLINDIYAGYGNLDRLMTEHLGIDVILGRSSRGMWDMVKYKHLDQTDPDCPDDDTAYIFIDNRRFEDVIL